MSIDLCLRTIVRRMQTDDVTSGIPVFSQGPKSEPRQVLFTLSYVRLDLQLILLVQRHRLSQATKEGLCFF